jgi:hypothetical protein
MSQCCHIDKTGPAVSLDVPGFVITNLNKNRCYTMEHLIEFFFRLGSRYSVAQNILGCSM